MDAIANNVHSAAKRLGWREGHEVDREDVCQAGQEWLAHSIRAPSSKGSLRAWPRAQGLQESSVLDSHPPIPRQAGCPALQTCWKIANHFLELTMHHGQLTVLTANSASPQAGLLQLPWK